MGYLTANDRPGQHANSWYAETAGPLPVFPILTGTAKADLCVIGGGYAGLSAALHAAERGLSVVLIEANRVGWGASGRNGGQVGIGPRAEMEAYEKAVGRDDARKVWNIATAANRLVRDLVSAHDIDCDLSNGYVEAAWRAREVRELHAYVEHLARHYDHTTARAVNFDEMAAMLGTDRYFGGYADSMGGHLHPLKFALGLAHAASDAGVQIFERSKAVEDLNACICDTRFGWYFRLRPTTSAHQGLAGSSSARIAYRKCRHCLGSAFGRARRPAVLLPE